MLNGENKSASFLLVRASSFTYPNLRSMKGGEGDFVILFYLQREL